MIFPPDFTYPERKTEVAAYVAGAIAVLAPARRVVVQAGGCAGLWPVALAKWFDQVYTFEPEPENYRCLQANIAGHPGITAQPIALGDRHATVGLTRHKPQAGLWRVLGAGDIPMAPLDDLIDGPVDALVLDVEGSEPAAWRGAAQLIAKWRPLLWFECLTHPAMMAQDLAAMGYGPPQQGHGGDWYSIHQSRMHEGE
jgi:FkbM family methyltransferase